MHPPSSADMLGPLADWFSRAARRLPWRAEDLDALHPDPYAVLVSELMLQQTQAATVIPYFLRWMERFPDPASLASASDDEVHKHWEGLGYYRRARYLKQAAQIISKEGWPGDLKGLGALPGLGPYTAAAVAAIAFQQPEAALDGNAFRVLSRLLALRDDPQRHAETLRRWLQPALRRFGPSRITQAVMELGASLCRPRPECGGCPLGAACEARRLDLTDQIPPARPRPVVQLLDIWLVALHAEDHWLLCPPSERGLLAGLWRWPWLEFGALEPPSGPPAPTVRSVRSWSAWTQTYTHRKEQVHPVCIELPHRFTPLDGNRWVHESELAALPLGKRDLRLRELLSGPGASADLEIPAHQLVKRIMPVGHDPLHR